MAYHIVWSPSSRDDLQEIVKFIASDNRELAEAFGYRLIARTEQLRDFPGSGRKVPEHHDPAIRELILRPYLIVYRVDHDRKCVEIVRVWHGARGTPELS